MRVTKPINKARFALLRAYLGPTFVLRAGSALLMDMQPSESIATAHLTAARSLKAHSYFTRILGEVSAV